MCHRNSPVHLVHGSLVIRLLNFDDVIMTSQNFLMYFRAQFPWVSQRPVVALGPINYGRPTLYVTLNHCKFHSITVIKRKASTIQIFEAKLPH